MASDQIFEATTICIQRTLSFKFSVSGCDDDRAHECDWLNNFEIPVFHKVFFHFTPNIEKSLKSSWQYLI